jgi:AcrR family transcriptional regulator
MVVTKQVSKNVSQRHAAKERRDRRTAESHRRINLAFAHLITRRPFGLIRVGEVARKARVGRATFYAHYASKDDLLCSQFAGMLESVLRPLPGSACPVDATAFFAHVRSSPDIYRGLMLSADAGHAPRLIRQSFESYLAQVMAKPPRRSSRYLTRYVAATLFSLVETWMETGLKDPDWQLQAMFKRLVESGLS